MFNKQFYFLFKKCKNKNDIDKYDLFEIDHIEKDSFYGRNDDFKSFLKQRIEDEKKLNNSCNYLWIKYDKAKELDLLW